MPRFLSATSTNFDLCTRELFSTSNTHPAIALCSAIFDYRGNISSKHKKPA